MEPRGEREDGRGSSIMKSALRLNGQREVAGTDRSCKLLEQGAIRDATEGTEEKPRYLDSGAMRFRSIIINRMGIDVL